MTRILMIALVIASGHARAETRCMAPKGAESQLSVIDAEERLGYLRAELKYGARRTRIWHWSWVSAYAGLTAYQLILAGVEPDRRNQNLLGAGASVVGVLSLVVMPRKILRDQKWLERRIAAAGPDADRCALLAEAERLLQRDAVDQEKGRGLLQHAGAFIFNLGIGLAMGLGLKDWDQAAITSVVGILISELQIITQPMHAISAWGRYRQGDLRPVRGHGLTVVALPTASCDSIGFNIAAAF